jgi:hypothetical protein
MSPKAAWLVMPATCKVSIRAQILATALSS